MLGAVLRIRIRVFWIQILELFSNPDPGKKHIFPKGNYKIFFWGGGLFVFNPKSRYFIKQ